MIEIAPPSPHAHARILLTRQYNGMRAITEDPDGFERNLFIKALAAEAKRGNSTKYRVLYEREKVDPTYLHDVSRSSS